MSVTRRGGDFFWLQCDDCTAEFHLLGQWLPGSLLTDKAAAGVLAGTVPGWKAQGPGSKLHRGPKCLARKQKLSA